MPAALIDGKLISAAVQGEIRADAEGLRAAGVEPCLAVILVGDDPASQIYVRNKARAAGNLGIRARDHLLPAETPQEELIGLISSLNRDPAVHGILVQLPLPGQLEPQRVIGAVAAEKDVDGLHPV